MERYVLLCTASLLCEVLLDVLEMHQLQQELQGFHHKWH